MKNRRLFVALEPPEPVRRRLAAMQAGMRRAAGAAAGEVRWVAPDAIHLTLQFLGAVPEERVAALEAAVAEAAAESTALRLEVRGAGGFPSARRPRVLWAGLVGDLEPLAALAAGVGRRLAPLGYPPEERAFSPHLTLGRAREARGAPGLGAAIASAAEQEGPPWRATDVCLVESHLSPSGARYEVVARFALGSHGG
jgi:2'-5' RNA ligase